MKIQPRLSLVYIMVLILVLFLVHPAAAQEQDGYPFTQLTIGQEPYESMVLAIHQDNLGFLWFGGTDGLNRYDGYEIKVFQYNAEDPLTISSNNILDIYTDTTGVLWVGTDEGLNRFDASTETFERYLNDPQNPSSLSNNQVEAIVEDASGTLWIGTRGGLNRFDRESGRFTRFLHDPADPSSLSFDQVFALAAGEDGKLWIGTYGGGLDELDPKRGELVHHRHRPGDPASLSSDLVVALHEDNEGVLWVGTWDAGLNRLDPETGAITTYRHDPDDPGSLADDRVNTINQDRQGILWAGTYAGLNRLDSETGIFTRFQNDEDPDSLSNNIVFGLFEDRQGLLWIGTFEGLNFYDPLRKPFRSYTSEPSNPNSLSDPQVLGILKDRSGRLWVGTPAGLNRIEGDHVTHYRHDPENPVSLGDDVVYALVEDSSGALWVGTWAGLDRLDPETGLFTHFPHDPDDPTSLSENTVYSLFIDRDGALWVGTFGGLNRFHPETGTFTRYLHDPQDPESLGANPVFAIQQDPSGTLWIGTQGGGLNRLDSQQGEFERYLHDRKDPQSISADSVWSISPDSSGDLWLGTSTGLDRFVMQSGSFQRFASQEGMPTGSVNGILPGSGGTLWLSTDRGLYRFKPENGAVDVFDKSDGLLATDFQRTASFRSPDGELFFGTSKGLIAVDPAAIEENPYVPPVFITGLELENEPVHIESGSLLEQTLLQTEALELPYWNRILTIEFSALNFRAPQENRYRYMLEGFDDDWREVGSDRRRVTYTNLDPGRYVFRVRGSNDDGIWNEAGTSVTINVIPPWWETNGFRVSMILLVAALLFSAHRLRTNAILQQNKRLEGAVADRTSELKETNLILQEEIVAHRQVEEELRLSEARYRTIFDTSGTAISISSPDARILLANDKYAQLSGYPKEELENGMKWTQIMHPLDADRVLGYSQRRWQDPSSAPRNYETRIVDRYGMVRHVVVTVGVIPDTNLAVASLLDITPRKELELALQRQNERYLLATRAARTGVFEWDLNIGSSYLDPSIKSVLGYQDHEIADELEAWYRHIHPQDRSSAIAAVQSAILGESGELVREYRMLAREGSIRWILTRGQVIRDEDGRPLRMIGTHQDITLRKLAEIESKASEERFRLVWEGAGDAFILVDPDGVVLEANPAFFELFGLKPETIIKKQVKDLVSEEDLGMVMEAFQSSRVQDKPLRIERQFSLPDGTSVIVDALINHLSTNGEQPPLLATLRDITDRKRAENSLQEARDQLATLLAISQNLVTTELDPLLNLILDQLTMVVPYEAASILGIEHERVELLLYRGSQLPVVFGSLGFNLAENPILQLLSDSKEIVYIEDAHAVQILELPVTSKREGWWESLQAYRSWMFLPLVVKAELIGCLVLSHTQPNCFAPPARSLAQAFANQAAIAMENARLYRQAQEVAVASERMRLARDLHDSVTQALYSINLYGEASRMAVAAGKADAAFKHLDDIQDLAREATTDLRVLIYELHPPILSEIGLVAALKNRLESVESRMGLETLLQADGDHRLPLQVETELFRVAQEALTNIMKHAHASRVQVNLEVEKDLVRLVIQDNGIGFDFREGQYKEGLGLRSLHERIQRIGGTLTIDSSTGSGTTLTVELRNLVLAREGNIN